MYTEAHEIIEHRRVLLSGKLKDILDQKSPDRPRERAIRAKLSELNVLDGLFSDKEKETCRETAPHHADTHV